MISIIKNLLNIKQTKELDLSKLDNQNFLSINNYPIFNNNEKLYFKEMLKYINIDNKHVLTLDNYKLLKLINLKNIEKIFDLNFIEKYNLKKIKNIYTIDKNNVFNHSKIDAQFINNFDFFEYNNVLNSIESRFRNNKYDIFSEFKLINIINEILIYKIKNNFDFTKEQKKFITQYFCKNRLRLNTLFYSEYNIKIDDITNILNEIELDDKDLLFLKKILNNNIDLNELLKYLEKFDIESNNNKHFFQFFIDLTIDKIIYNFKNKTNIDNDDVLKIYQIYEKRFNIINNNNNSIKRDFIKVLNNINFFNNFDEKKQIFIKNFYQDLMFDFFVSAKINFVNVEEINFLNKNLNDFTKELLLLKIIVNEELRFYLENSHNNQILEIIYTQKPLAEYKLEKNINILKALNNLDIEKNYLYKDTARFNLNVSIDDEIFKYEINNIIKVIHENIDKNMFSKISYEDKEKIKSYYEKNLLMSSVGVLNKEQKKFKI